MPSKEGRSINISLNQIKTKFKGQTIKEIVQLQHKENIPTLLMLERNHKEILNQSIALLLIEINDCIGAVRGLTNKQLDTIIELLPLRFPYLRMNDLYLICERFKTSEYRVLDRLDVPTFLGAVKLYESEKGEIDADIIEQRVREDKIRFNGFENRKRNDFKEKQSEAISRYIQENFKENETH